MKRFLILVAASLFLGIKSDAQIPLRSAKTTAIADTIVHPLVGSGVVSLTATWDETSGTSAGKFYFEGSVENGLWQHIDSSKSAADEAAIQGITVAVTSTIFQSYRVRFSNTSTATGRLTFTVLRRPDE